MKETAFSVLMKIAIAVLLVSLFGCSTPRLCAPPVLQSHLNLVAAQEEARHNFIVAACWDSRE